MHRWTSLLGALMLVLMVWTGGAAHAAEQFDCIPVTSETAGHYEGDGDQSPSAPDQGVAHHHAGCNGHHMAAPTDAGSLAMPKPDNSAPLYWREAGIPGRGPESHLRPPIA